MKKLLVLLLLLSSPVIANEPPPVPEGGLQFFMQDHCIDNESGQKGYCYMGTSKEGKTYLMFWQNGILMLIREVVGDSYITIWVNDQFDTV